MLSRFTRSAASVILALAAAAGHAQQAASRDPYLELLPGHWQMVGQVQGERAQYEAQGEWVLQGTWLRLHMVETSRPPKYEANLYLAFDPSTGEYVAHWLDGFGAAGARVVGTGRRDGPLLTLHFPYAGSPFRDTLRLDPDGRAGSLRIESQSADGGWALFAEYALRRSTAADGH
jgi:hypothetical protein